LYQSAAIEHPFQGGNRKGSGIPSAASSNKNGGIISFSGRWLALIPI
jgi:hypothetical protein